MSSREVALYDSNRLPETEACIINAAEIARGLQIRGYTCTEAALRHPEINHDSLVNNVLRSPFLPDVSFRLFGVADGHHTKGAARSPEAAEASYAACLMAKNFGFLSLDPDGLQTEMEIMFQQIHVALPTLPEVGEVGRTTLMACILGPTHLIYRGIGDSPLFTIDEHGNFTRRSIDHGTSFQRKNYKASLHNQKVLDDIGSYNDILRLKLSEEGRNALMHDFVNRNVLHATLGGGALLTSFGNIPLETIRGIFIASDGIKDPLTTKRLTKILQGKFSNNIITLLFNPGLWGVKPNEVVDEMFAMARFLVGFAKEQNHPPIRTIDDLNFYSKIPNASIRVKDDDRTAILYFLRGVCKRIYNPSIIYKIKDLDTGELFDALYLRTRLDEAENVWVSDFSYYKGDDRYTATRGYFEVKADNQDRLLRVA